MTKKTELTPVMQQYVDMKAECPGAVLLFRLGDFYESFFEDAKIISRALDLVLTKRGTDADGDQIPMCGIPWHAAENYMARLVRGGYSVAIAEQMETPEEAKARGRKQIERKIVRVLTAGTLTDENLLSPKKSNFLVAVVPTELNNKSEILNHKFEIAGCDISTGEFFVGELDGDVLTDELCRLNPAEIIYPESAAESPVIKRVRETFKTTPIYDRLFARENIGQTATDIFKIEQTQINTAIHLLAGYLDMTQRGATLSFRAPYRLGAGARLLCDAATWRSLEIDEAIQPGGATLLDVIDKTRTSAGARRLRAYLRELSGDMDEIRRRQERIGHLCLNSDVALALRATLSKVPDIGRAISRLLSNRGTPRDLRAISEFACMLPNIKTIGARLDADMSAQFAAIDTNDNLALELKSALADNLPAFFREGGVIRQGYDCALDHMNSLAHGAREVIAGLQSEYAASTGSVSLKIKYNNILGYYIEVPSKQADKLFVPESGFIHRQTMVGNVRFTTARLIELDNEVRGAADRARGIEQEIIARLIEMVKDASGSLMYAADLLADADVWGTLAECAEEYRWVRPVITDDCGFDVRGGRHPVVEKILRSRAQQFVRNDCVLSAKPTKQSSDCRVQSSDNNENKSNSELCNLNSRSYDQCIALITGPNMAGKSTYLRQNALIVVLAHLGSFVPADSAKIGICDQLFSRVGASDNLAAGQSTFMVEMTETANILNRATEKSFIIFDEIGRGTATFDGLSIAWAVLEFLDKLAPRTLFATHYHELTSLVRESAEFRVQSSDKNKLNSELCTLNSVKALTISVAEHNNEIIFLHKIVPGVATSSYGIHVAKMAGMPDAVVLRAEQVLGNLEGNKSSDCRVQSSDSDKSKFNSELCNLNSVKISEPARKPQMSLFGD